MIVGAHLRRHADAQVAQRAVFVAGVVEEARVVRRERRRRLRRRTRRGRRPREIGSSGRPARPRRDAGDEQQHERAHEATRGRTVALQCPACACARASPGAPCSRPRQYNARAVGSSSLRARAVAIARRDAGRTDRQTPDGRRCRPASALVDRDHRSARVRIEGSDRPDARDRRRAPRAVCRRSFARLPVDHRRHAGARCVRACRPTARTDPALRADVTVRVPRTARDRSRAGRRRHASRSTASRHAHRRHSPRADRRRRTCRARCGSRPASARSTLTDARLSPNGLLRLRAFNGDVRLSLAERPADARIMALALNGTITSDIPLTMHDTLGAALGRGDARQGRAGDLARRRDRDGSRSKRSIGRVLTRPVA